MSTPNLHRCIRNNRIEAGDLENIARILNVNIGVFFDDDVAHASFTQIGDGVQAQKIDKVLMGGAARRAAGKKEPSHDELLIENGLLKALLEEKDKRISEKDDFISHLKSICHEADKA